MNMEWNETIILDKASIKKTSDGFLVGESRVARTGIQMYRGDEMGDKRATVRVFRPTEEVFDKASLASFAHKPITFGHPPELVNAQNWKKFAVGHLDGEAGREVAQDGEYVRVPWYLFDAETIAAVESGKAKELSVGYVADIKFEDGKTPAGDAYDAVQRGIRVNHLAVVPLARGGSKLKLGDDERREQMANRVVTLGDGIEITLPDAEAVSVQKVIDKLNGQVAALTQQVADAQKAAKDATLTPQQLDQRVAERSAIVVKAKTILGDTFKPEGIADADIKRQVVAKKLTDEVAKAMSDAAIDGAFMALVANLPTDGKQPVTDATRQFATMLITTPQQVNDANAARDKAWEERGAAMRDAWKTASLPAQ